VSDGGEGYTALLEMSFEYREAISYDAQAVVEFNIPTITL